MLISYILRIFKLIWKVDKLWLFYSSFFILILGMLPVGTILITKELINNIALLIENKSESNTLAIVLLISQFMLLILETVIKQFQTYLEQQLSFKLNRLLTEQIANKSIKIPYSNFDDPNFYNYTNRVRSNTGPRLLSPINNLFSIIQSLIALTSLIIFLISIHWSLALISTFAFIPTLLIKSYLGNKGFQLQKDLTPIVREASYIENLIMEKESAREVRVFNLYPHFIDRWKRKYTENMKISLSFLKTKSKAEIFLDGIIAISYCSSAGIIIWLIKKSAVKIGEFVSIGQAVHSTQNSLHSISASIALLYEDTLYIHDYFNYIDSFEENESNTKNTITFPSKLYQGIRFENVSFSYPNSQKEVLKNVSFSIKPGEKIAIVGHNGSGKTSLIKCLLGLYPLTSGNIYFDDVPINKIQLNSLRDNITVIFQDFTKYFLTIEENIAFGNISERNDKKKIQDVALQSGIHTDITKFPNKYQSYVGRFLYEGEELSGGQWQKVAIARALFKNSPIMILDEPTAALDPLSERVIFDKFKQLTEERTTLLISHKMSAAKLADKIIVLDNGKLVEFGTHEQLVLQKGKYHELYTTQAEFYDNKIREYSER
ncbi:MULTISPECIES: ABC transporter ATP-binding protein [Bacillus]|uniref:Putative ABC transport system ATP-binding protein n=1 Tax=Bacillus mycoides TaxID=1405 RepID=A0A3D9VB54_BACMY|nr:MULTISPECIES: ABC transporter ATP-binding protein [Bacillus]RBP24937.1 putative ABC transport system ATP-binding protein [Bacillus sp. DB-2]REF38516.1 putative ABC transport system ATP-binding protein [Bacillus mycoides]